MISASGRHIPFFSPILLSLRLRTFLCAPQSKAERRPFTVPLGARIHLSDIVEPGRPLFSTHQGKTGIYLWGK
jgi:hypothetical protein